ncbi:MAG: SEC-C domain-containing protein [Prevotella sp.]|nr:SEC-C domain-containing protein [Prevotella sp.]
MAVNTLSVCFGHIADCIQTSAEVKNPLTQAVFQSKGIWDTGAMTSAVTKDVANQLGLQPVQKASVRGVNGVNIANVYLVAITLNNKNITVKTRVTECDALSDDNSVGVLIGMDIISLGDFCITNYEGKTVMTFRVPSLESIDYVKEPAEFKKYRKLYEERKKHGNELCPCGSGKKYKNCHEKSVYGK